MAEELIDLVRQHKVLYDTKSKDYKDQVIRNTVWEEIAKTLNKSVDSCKDDWTRLRNSFASVLKRRRNKSGPEAAVAVTPWRYEEQMSFLCPFMKSRKTKTEFIGLPARLASESPPAPASLYPGSASRCSTESSTSSRHNPGKTDIMQDLLELRKSSHSIRMQQNGGRERETGENDLFFLSMSRAVENLPMREQIKIKTDLHAAVSQAQIRQLEK